MPKKRFKSKTVEVPNAPPGESRKVQVVLDSETFEQLRSGAFRERLTYGGYIKLLLKESDNG